MGDLIAFVTMHLLPPTAAFAAWNDYRQRRVLTLLMTVVGAATAGIGLLITLPWVGLTGLMMLLPSVLRMRRDFRGEEH
ncbi:hypothetical protein [Streptomyces niveus]|uniref:hypothetical protein n=1 Tax=Streptomyces niveus TaxID=193462 RepID=UPI003441B95F